MGRISALTQARFSSPPLGVSGGEGSGERWCLFSGLGPGCSPWLLRFLAESSLDSRCDFRGVGLRRGLKPLQDLPVASDQEFVEVPFDVAGKRRFFAGECDVKRMAVCPVYFD